MSESAASLFHALRRGSIENVRLIDCSLGLKAPSVNNEPDFGPAHSIPIVAPMPLRGTLWAQRSPGFVHAAALAWSPARLVLIKTPTAGMPLACAHRASLTKVYIDEEVDADVLGELALNASIRTMSIYLESCSDRQLRQVDALLRSESAFPSLDRLVIRYPPVTAYYDAVSLRGIVDPAQYPGRALVVVAEDARDDEDQAAFVRRMIETEKMSGA